jgi:hypothetical protein
MRGFVNLLLTGRKSFQAGILFLLRALNTSSSWATRPISVATGAPVQRARGRQPLNLCSPLDCKSIAANVENDAVADHLISFRPVRKLDDPLHCMLFQIRRCAIFDAPALVRCEPRHHYRTSVVAFSFF